MVSDLLSPFGLPQFLGKAFFIWITDLHPFLKMRNDGSILKVIAVQSGTAWAQVPTLQQPARVYWT